MNTALPPICPPWCESSPPDHEASGHVRLLVVESGVQIELAQDPAGALHVGVFTPWRLDADPGPLRRVAAAFASATEQVEAVAR